MTDVPFKKKLGAKLERLRKAKGLTQKELAAAADMPLSTYSGCAIGAREPDLQRLQRLARALGTTINDLLEDDAIFQYRYRQALDYIITAGFEPEINPDGSITISVRSRKPGKFVGFTDDGGAKFSSKESRRFLDKDSPPPEENILRIKSPDAHVFVEFVESVIGVALAANTTFRAAAIIFFRDIKKLAIPDDFEV